MILPIVLRRHLDGANGRNWPGLVILDPGAPEPAAVLAQEVFEARWKLNPLNLWRRLTSSYARREMELRSHEIEVRAAVDIYGADEATRRAKEAGGMVGQYGKLFDGWDAARIELGMMRHRSAALNWLRDNLSDVLRHAEVQR